MELLQISLQFLAMVTVTLCQPSFQVEPVPNTVLEGGNFTLYCIVTNLLPSHNVLWYRSGSQISTGSVIDQHQLQDPHRFSVEVDKVRGQYNLMISAITLADDTEYYCKVTESGTTVLESNRVRLEVHHVPSAKYPSCFPLNKESFVAGETITLTCKSERGNPPVALSWFRKEEVLPLHIDDSQTGYRDIDYEFTVGPENHGDIFQCKLTSSAANTHVRRSCSLGPLNVMYPPTEVVLETTSNVAADQEMEVICISDANPIPVYTWTLSNNFDQNRINFFEDGKKIVFTTAPSDNGTIITCNATNEYGMATSQLTLNFNPTQTNPVYGTTPSRTIMPNDNGPDDSAGIPSKPQTETPDNVVLKPEVLAIVASTLTLILIVLIALIVITCRCRPQTPKTVNQMPQMIYGQYGPTSVQGWEQGSIYFEPRDRISVRDMPTWQRPTPWHRNVAVQVPWVDEPPYEEIGQNWDEGMTLEI